MSTADKISRFATQTARSMASLVKVVLLSRRTRRDAPAPQGREIIILGNGPSLRQFIDRDSAFMESRDRMAVNFAANTPEFARIRPERYILADPHFFATDGGDPNVERLWQNLCNAGWTLTLHIPARMAAHPRVREFTAAVENHATATFNLTPADGFGPLRRALYARRLAMPRPRNVMIPAIMAAIHAGYRRIYLAGADHTWSRTLSVDDSNRVVSVQPHFYTDTESERQRVSTEYAGYRLHDILHSLCVAFGSYHLIADFARRRGISIINITPGSFIDAFPRQNPQANE